MTGYSLDPLVRYDTFRATVTALPALVTSAAFADLEEIEVTSHRPPEESPYLVTFSPANELLPGGDIFSSILLEPFWGRITTSPKRVFLLSLSWPADASTTASGAIAEIKKITGFTNDQIAPMMGVSRRSLQAWIAGGPISHRNEERLLELGATIRALDAGCPDTTRRRLLDHKPGQVRVYDLLSSAHFDIAMDVAIGSRRRLPPRERSPGEDLVTYLDRLEDRVAIAEASPTGRFLRRKPR